MANFFRPAETPRSPSDPPPRRPAAKPPVPPPALDSVTDEDGAIDFDVTVPWNPDEALKREMARLEAARSFPVPDAPPSLGAMSSPFGALEPHLPGAKRPAAGVPLPSLLMSDMAGAYLPGEASGDVARLRAENAELTKLLEETRAIFEQATQQEQERTRQAEEVALLLREKDGHIELLTGQIHELEQHLAQSHADVPVVPKTPHEEDLMRMADELEQEQVKLSRDRKVLDEERHQLHEDEESLMRQMREMEVGMAKERAELARQRTDLQRLHADVRRELEQLTGGDRALNERLAQFQRRHTEVFGRPAAPPPGPPVPPAAPPAPPATSQTPPEGGTVRRFFGGKR